MVNLEPLLSLLPYLLLNHTVLPFLLTLNSLWRILRVYGRRILNIIVAFENASQPKKNPLKCQPYVSSSGDPILNQAEYVGTLSKMYSYCLWPTSNFGKLKFSRVDCQQCILQKQMVFLWVECSLTSATPPNTLSSTRYLLEVPRWFANHSTLLRKLEMLQLVESHQPSYRALFSNSNSKHINDKLLFWTS